MVCLQEIKCLDEQFPREPIEELGSYDPRARTFAEKVRMDAERAAYWIGVGAQPSETVQSFLRKLGVRRGGAGSAAAAGTAAPVGDAAPAGEA